ncbi:MAG: hypothetical protein M1837_000706 [Sclerophora amabilis]|nr:MAG: hypothetical protein M1837_000706 [Sclerophora amabilis]
MTESQPIGYYTHSSLIAGRFTNISEGRSPTRTQDETRARDALQDYYDWDDEMQMQSLGLGQDENVNDVQLPPMDDKIVQAQQEDLILRGPVGWNGTDFGEGESWEGEKLLGRGAMGVATLWVKRKEGRIIKEMVIKEVEYFKDRMSETHYTEVLQDTDCLNILRLLHDVVVRKKMGYRTRPLIGTYKHRLYLEFCRHEDLYSLMDRYRITGSYLPEPFLWDVFHSLVRAAKIMAHGTYKKKPVWKRQLVHRDLKPANIFLSDPSEVISPYYPVVKVADFSHGVILSDGDAGDNHEGTLGYNAPEQYGRAQRPGLHGFLGETNSQVSWWTNVWQIGTIMYELLDLDRFTTNQLHFHPESRNYEEMADRVTRWRNDEETGDLIDPINREVTGYSETLCRLVYRCLEMKGKDRPSLNRLLRKTKKNFQRSRKAMRQTLKLKKLTNPKPGQNYPGKLFFRKGELPLNQRSTEETPESRLMHALEGGS